MIVVIDGQAEGYGHHRTIVSIATSWAEARTSAKPTVRERALLYYRQAFLSVLELFMLITCFRVVPLVSWPLATTVLKITSPPSFA